MLILFNKQEKTFYLREVRHRNRVPEATSHSRHGFLFERRRVAVPGMAYWVGPPARLTSPLLTYIFIYYLTTSWATLLVGHATAQSTLVGHKIVIQTEVSKETKKKDRTNLKWKGKKLEIQTKVKNKTRKTLAKEDREEKKKKTETKRLIVSTNYINLHAREARAKQKEETCD